MISKKLAKKRHKNHKRIFVSFMPFVADLKNVFQRELHNPWAAVTAQDPAERVR